MARRFPGRLRLQQQHAEVITIEDEDDARARNINDWGRFKSELEQQGAIKEKLGLKDALFFYKSLMMSNRNNIDIKNHIARIFIAMSWREDFALIEGDDVAFPGYPPEAEISFLETVVESGAIRKSTVKCDCTTGQLLVAEKALVSLAGIVGDLGVRNSKENLTMKFKEKMYSELRKNETIANNFSVFGRDVSEAVDEHARYRCFYDKRPGTVGMKEDEILVVGLWASFTRIGHSCLDPNCSWVIHGDTLFIRTLRPLKEGDTVIISHVSPSLKYSERQSRLRKFGLVCCTCLLCITDMKESMARMQAVKKAIDEFLTLERKKDVTEKELHSSLQKVHELHKWRKQRLLLVGMTPLIKRYVYFLVSGRGSKNITSALNNLSYGFGMCIESALTRTAVYFCRVALELATTWSWDHVPHAQHAKEVEFKTWSNRLRNALRLRDGCPTAEDAFIDRCYNKLNLKSNEKTFTTTS